MKEIDTFYLSEKQIEQYKRKRKFNYKMKKAATLFLVGVASSIALGFIPEKVTAMGIGVSLAINFAKLFSSGTVIKGVCDFAKALHQPLTEKEAQELAERDAIEKGGYSK